MAEQAKVEEMACPGQQTANLNLDRKARSDGFSVPPSSSSSSSSSSSCCGTRLWRMEFSLRCVALIASVSALAFLVTDKQTRSFVVFTSTIVQEAAFSDMKVIVCTVIVLAAVALHSILQILRCFSGPASVSIPPASPIAWAIFLLDQFFTYLLLSSLAAAAQSGWFSEEGNAEFGWMKVCYLYEKFCKQAGSGMAGSFIACVALMFTSVISAFNLFVRLDFAECHGEFLSQ